MHWIISMPSREGGFTEALFTIGLYPDQSADTQRNIILTNIVSVIFSISSFVLGVFVYLGVDYFRPLNWIFLLLMVLFIFPLFLNHLRYHHLSRVILSCLPSTMVIVFSIKAKLTIDDITFNDYYNFRIALIALCTIPLLLFSLSEKVMLGITASYCFLTLFLSDRIHHLFNVGFYDIGFQDRHYDFINMNSVVASLSIMMCIVALKKIIERQEVEKQALMDRLTASHEEVLAQRDELIAQGEKLNQSQLQLFEAYEKIQKHKMSLEEELALYDSEITQFSYNVCHHLRGPVASLSGLVNIYSSQMDHEKEVLLPHFRKEINNLESVVADLNYVLQVRRELFHKRSLLSLTKVFWEVQSIRAADISRAGAIVKVDFERAPVVFASKIAIISIFDNLLSNAIKFRDENARLIIEVSSRIDGHTKDTIIEIKDNGLGIDLEKFEDDLFKMYKRFHLHIEGKGLGLYLVKLQVKALGGSISLESKVNEFTRFIVRLPQQKQPD